MADENIPEHRTAITPRSGDTHVIGADGEAVNVDQAARDEAVAAEAAAEAAAEKAAARKTKPVPDESGKTDPVT